MKLLSIISLTCIHFISFAQDTLTLNRVDAEAIFIKNNLTLLAEKLQIAQAQAEVIQAKLWPNPTFEISEINLWATENQTGGATVSPPFGNNNFGRNQQVALELAQVIYTAGKRKKLIAIEQVGVHQQEQYFQDVIRNLKWELRTQLTSLQHLQQNQAIYQTQINAIQKLINAYQNQLDKGNIAKSEFVRLRAQSLTLTKALSDISIEILAAQKELKMLLGVHPDTYLKIDAANFVRATNTYKQLQFLNLLHLAKENRPDIKIALLENELQERTYQYELAQRTPDITLSMNYDRNGNTMLNFIGFGMSMDLPFFNRNQGNIRKAKIGIEAAQIKSELAQLTVENEIALAQKNLQTVIQFADNIDAQYEQTLDELLTVYTKNFTARNVSLLEYLDFLDTYIENKRIMIDAQKDINDKIEALNYCIGTDL